MGCLCGIVGGRGFIAGTVIVGGVCCGGGGCGPDAVAVCVWNSGVVLRQQGEDGCCWAGGEVIDFV